ncbi:hypothetical protein HMPREF9016_01601 [Neisseria sp. oral taxon 014 str. F0314]|uniref:hypothetical protein n=1 Tax=Neisseria sp. oral taxon 014 TaxID=641148 RepID=UPI0001D8C95A|nr:hypothetical protein [Neisseria sp. oral taxon 014]EFI23213.1 hypothetical protein HMPREF9016_01601 [Neisseria sp. oral taxon 014 str. F0314]
MMDVTDLIGEGFKLFNEKKYAEAIEKLHQAWDRIIDKSTQIAEQIRIQYVLGCCYYKQAIKTKDENEADKLFDKAVKHYQEWLQFKQENIQDQINVQSWIVYCYYTQLERTKNIGRANELFIKAIKHNKERWKLADQLDEKKRICEKNRALSLFVGCHFQQAMKTNDTDNASKMFKKAAAFSRLQLWLSGKLENEKNRIEKQIFAQFVLCCCYIERVKKIKTTFETEKFAKYQASKYFSAAYAQLSQLSDEAEKKEWKKTIRQGLREIDYLNKDWHSYFEKKKQEIQESLFKVETSQPQDAVATILAVLHITPIELGFTPMAHYTSPHVCHILFGIGGNETASPMRLGSSTYMNDPSEGKALLDLLNQQDLELENKADGASHNAFFTCFSSRVNDLNQFRLYGKEGGVEASGCCLVFNKNGDWLRETDVSASFHNPSQKSGQDSDDPLEAGISDNGYEKLPLYQVAYVAYKDEYIADKKCGIWLSAPNKAFNLYQNLAKENLGSSIRFTLDANISRFGIRLNPLGNEEWHQFRLEKLKEALEELIRFFGDKSAVSDDDKEALEYIRYLFKDFAFRDEEEFRLLVIKPIDSEEIEYCETTQSVYIPYTDIRNRADEVILGTNYEKTGNQRKAEVFRYQMKQKCPDVKVSRSTLPINPPNK